MSAYVILPAAGHSRRMGTAKLLLPWGSSPTLIDAVLDQWHAAPVAGIACVVRADDEALQHACRRHAIELVMADPPPAEMKHSVACGLEHVRTRFAPRPDDAWLLAPADLPYVDRTLVERLLAEHERQPAAIIAPTYRGKRGHPVLFPWALAASVGKLARAEGVNALLERNAVHEIVVHDPLVLEDVDTPDDYERLRP